MSPANPKDTRTRQEKLEAMANQAASPHEAEVARQLLSRLAEAPKAHESKRASISRDGVAETPSRPPSQGVRVLYPGGVWHHFDAEDVDWEMVDAHHLLWRLDGEDKERRGGRPPRLDPRQKLV